MNLRKDIRLRVRLVETCAMLFGYYFLGRRRGVIYLDRGALVGGNPAKVIKKREISR